MRFIVTFLILLGFWVFMSGLLDPWHLGLGIASCALVASMSSRLLFPGEMKGAFGAAIKFAAYVPWLLYQVVIANIYVIRLVFNPRMMEKIQPHVVRFKTRLKTEASLVTFANSITLTPGTIVVLIQDASCYVHAIDRTIVESLPGEMEERVGRIFGE